MQNNIEAVLKDNPLIPVVTIESEDQIQSTFDKLRSQGVNCIEITLRTDFAWNAIEIFKKQYSEGFQVGVGTITNVEQVQKCKELNVDFMVSPGLTNKLAQELDKSGIPFLPGVSTPSEIIQAMEYGWKFFKFFPANLFGGIDALKTYGSVFPEVKFCPTGGISESNHKDFLALKNVLSVGGSWLTK